MLYGHHGALEVEWPRARAESENCIEPRHTKHGTEVARRQKFDISRCTVQNLYDI